MHIHTLSSNIIFGTSAAFKVRTHACSYKKNSRLNLLHLWEAKVDIVTVIADLLVVNGFNANISAGELFFKSRNGYFSLENTEDVCDAVVLDDDPGGYYYNSPEVITIDANVVANRVVRTDLEISPVVIEESY